MAKPFSFLKNKMSSDARQLATQKASQLMKALLLHENKREIFPIAYTLKEHC